MECFWVVYRFKDGHAGLPDDARRTDANADCVWTSLRSNWTLSVQLRVEKVNSIRKTVMYGVQLKSGWTSTCVTNQASRWKADMSTFYKDDRYFNNISWEGADVLHVANSTLAYSIPSFSKYSVEARQRRKWPTVDNLTTPLLGSLSKTVPVAHWMS